MPLFMRILLITNLLLFACLVSAFAQPCYREYLEDGVKAYKAQQYLVALQKFEAAADCPDKSSTSTLEEWTSKAKKAYYAYSKKQATNLDSLQIAKARADSLIVVLQANLETITHQQQLALAQSMAFRSLQTSPENQLEKALLSLKAYQIQQQEGGSLKDPNIFRSLYYSLKAIKGEDFNKITTSKNAAIYFMQYQEKYNQVITGNNLGAILKYSNDSSWTQFVDTSLHWDPLALLNPDAPLTIWDISPDESWIGAAGPGSKIYLWNRSTGQKITQNLHQQTSLRTLLFTPDLSGIITSGLDNYINKYHFSAMGSEQLMTNGAPIADMILTADNRLIYCGTDGLLMSLKMAPTKKLDILSENFSARVSKLAVGKMQEKDGEEQEILVAGLKSGLIKLYKLNDDKILFFRELFTHRGVISDIQITEDGMMVVVGLDGKVSVWDLDQINDPAYVPLILDDHKWALTTTYIKDSNCLLVGSKDGSIRHWILDPDAYAQKLCDYLQTQDIQEALYINGQEILIDLEELCPNPEEPIK